MEQLYLIEFYIKSVCLKTPPGGVIPAEDKKLTVNIDFGKFASLIVNENEFSDDILLDDISDDEMEEAPLPPAIPVPLDSAPSAPTVQTNNAQQSQAGKCCMTSDDNKTHNGSNSDDDDYAQNTVTEKTFNSGASVMFSHNPAGLQQTFRLFPLDLSVWTDDATEMRACIGIAKMIWDSEFLEMVGKCPEKPLQFPEQPQQQLPLTLQTQEDLRSQTNGSVIGQICCMVRLTILGHKVITRFRKADDGNGFVFRNRMANSSVRCKKYGVNTKPEEITSYGQQESSETEGMDVGKIIASSKAANEPSYAAGNQMRGLEKLNRNMTIPCGNQSCKLTEIIQKSAGIEANKGCKIGPASACSPVGTMGLPHKDDCCCNCKYLNIPLEKGTLPTFSDKQKTVTCEVCGGISYDGKTCKDKDKPQCTGPCNLEKEGNDKDPNVQRMLYEGLTKMLSNARSGNHKQFCPDFKHKSSCPIGGACCQ